MTEYPTMDARIAIHKISTALADVGYGDANVHWKAENSDLVVEVLAHPQEARQAILAVYNAYRLLHASIGLGFPGFDEYMEWMRSDGGDTPWWRIDFYMPEDA